MKAVHVIAVQFLWSGQLGVPSIACVLPQYMYTYKHVLCMYVPKSSLERVSNVVRGCIDGVYRELRHESAMNIILRFLAK